MGFDSRLLDAAQCSGYAYGWTEVELREIVWRVCCHVVLSHDERWK